MFIKKALSCASNYVRKSELLTFVFPYIVYSLNNPHGSQNFYFLHLYS